MSLNQPAPVPARKSFAQVAAAANVPLKAKEKSTNAADSARNAQNGSQVADGKPEAIIPRILERPEEASLVPTVPIPSTKDEPRNVENLSRLMDTTNLQSGTSQPSLDCAPQKATSDTKSVTSRTTLTLDEKDSLRPDDSASMQAAVEDDMFSPGGSAVADSRQGSDPDSRAFHDQLYEIDRTGSRHAAVQNGLPVVKATSIEQTNGGILYAPYTVPETFTPPHPTMADVQLPPPTTWNIPPDEKLVEALASPKDRLFVLKIEQDMIDFVKDSKEEYLQLPQTNSFYRMLSHKLADYYLLGHFIDDSMMSVRIFRTPNCRLPPPLIGPNPLVDGSTPPPSAPARKIMRRRDGKTYVQATGSDKNFDSLTSSMATSDVGASNTPDETKDTPNGTGEKSSLTREERENRYNEVRARIFKDFEASENLESVIIQADKGISRASSTSGGKKNKKNRRPKDDGFEARSAFDQYGQRIVSNEFPQQLPDPVYDPYSPFATQNQYPGGISPFQPPQGVPIPTYNVPEGYGPIQYNPWPAQPVSHGYPQAHNSGMQDSFNIHNYHPMNGFDGTQYSAANLASQATPKGNAPSLATYHQGYMPQNDTVGWSQGTYMNPYASAGYGYNEVNRSHAGCYAPQSMPPAMSPVPYESFPAQNAPFFGQTSPYTNFNQPHFNPRSQNFVPATRGSSMQSFSPEPNMGYSNSRPGYLGDVSMQLPLSNNSHGPSFSPMPIAHHQNANMRGNANGQGLPRPQLSSSRGPAPPQSSITTWSTPANLPAKPPPPAVISPYVEVARDPDNQRPLPPKPFSATDHASNNVKNLAIR